MDNTVRLWSLASGQCVATIKSFHEAVLSLAWRQAVKGQTQLVTAGEDKSIKGWRIEEKDDKCEVLLEWRSYYAQAALTATGARIEGAVGLSELNARLFEQLGAEAEL
ncbi:MAG: WD domain, G-beta repeat [Glomeribacter sp. 1016415]|nr:WD domain, G-beta repeat [Glomeribacter sp. 1016415]